LNNRVKQFILILFCLSGFLAILEAQTIIEVAVEQPDSLVADAGEDQVITSDTTVTLGGDPAARGGQGPYWYEWSNQEGIIGYVPNMAVSPSSSTEYTLEVTDRNLCTARDSVRVEVQASGIVSGENAPILFYPNPVSGQFTVEGATVGSQISLIDATGTLVWQEVLDGTAVFHVPDTPGIYVVLVRDMEDFTTHKIHVK
jgi:hypothetical protein